MNHTNIMLVGSYDAISIANYFIKLACHDKTKYLRKITLMKLIKLVYLAHGWSLAFYDKPLINEIVEAWPYGPVIPSVYHAFKDHGRFPIKKPGMTVDLVKGEIVSPAEVREKKIAKLLEKVWHTYRTYTSLELSNLTNMKETAWYKTTYPYRKISYIWAKNLHISNGDIKHEFNRLLDN